MESNHIRERAYEKYIVDWLWEHGHSLYELIGNVAEHAVDDQNIEPTAAWYDWETETDCFNGSCYVCYDEFLGAEYQDEDYMRQILTTDEFIEYQLDIEEN